MDMLLEWLLFAASCLVIVASALGMRAVAMKDREKLRRPMTSFMFVDQGGPFDWKIVDIGSPMDVALGPIFKKNEKEKQEPQQ